MLDGIDAALQAGFAPIKLNMVVKRGINEHDIPAMLERFGGPEYIVRFIEYMDVGTTNGWRLDEVVPAEEILARAAEAGPLTPLPAHYGGEVARRYRTARGGELGVISSVTQPFCSACTRARLSADGHLYHCLFATSGLDLRAPLRSGLDDAALVRAHRRLLAPPRRPLLRAAVAIQRAATEGGNVHARRLKQLAGGALARS